MPFTNSVRLSHRSAYSVLHGDTDPGLGARLSDLHDRGSGMHIVPTTHLLSSLACNVDVCAAPAGFVVPAGIRMYVLLRWNSMGVGQWESAEAPDFGCSVRRTPEKNVVSTLCGHHFTSRTSRMSWTS